jgi:hypothetical protein
MENMEEGKFLLKQFNGIGSILKIQIEDYHYQCGDGCCDHYGTVTTVNGIELFCHDQDAEAILRQVLEHLGYKVEIIEPK